eukprot:3932097-Rhodomonas_salina.1
MAAGLGEKATAQVYLPMRCPVLTYRIAVVVYAMSGTDLPYLAAWLCDVRVSSYQGIMELAMLLGGRKGTLGE